MPLFKKKQERRGSASKGDNLDELQGEAPVVTAPKRKIDDPVQYWESTTSVQFFASAADDVLVSDQALAQGGGSAGAVWRRGKGVTLRQELRPEGGASTNIAAVSAWRATAFFGCFDGAIIRLHVADGTVTELVAPREEDRCIEVLCMAGSPGEEMLEMCLVGTAQGNIRGYSGDAGEEQMVIKAHGGGVNGLDWVPNSRVAISSSEDDPEIRCWRQDGKDWPCCRKISGFLRPDHKLRKVVWDQFAGSVAAADSKGTLYLWANVGEETMMSDADVPPPMKLTEELGGVHHLAAHYGDIVSADDRQIKVHDATTGRLLQFFNRPADGNISALAVGEGALWTLEPKAFPKSVVNLFDLPRRHAAGKRTTPSPVPSSNQSFTSLPQQREGSDRAPSPSQGLTSNRSFGGPPADGMGKKVGSLINAPAPPAARRGGQRRGSCEVRAAPANPGRQGSASPAPTPQPAAPPLAQFPAQQYAQPGAAPPQPPAPATAAIPGSEQGSRQVSTAWSAGGGQDSRQTSMTAAADFRELRKQRTQGSLDFDEFLSNRSLEPGSGSNSLAAVAAAAAAGGPGSQTPTVSQSNSTPEVAPIAPVAQPMFNAFEQPAPTYPQTAPPEPQKQQQQDGGLDFFCSLGAPPRGDAGGGQPLPSPGVHPALGTPNPAASGSSSGGTPLPGAEAAAARVSPAAGIPVTSSGTTDDAQRQQPDPARAVSAPIRPPPRRPPPPQPQRAAPTTPAPAAPVAVQPPPAAQQAGTSPSTPGLSSNQSNGDGVNASILLKRVALLENGIRLLGGIGALEQAKGRAVQGEDYGAARQLKEVIDALQNPVSPGTPGPAAAAVAAAPAQFTGKPALAAPSAAADILGLGI